MASIVTAYSVLTEWIVRFVDVPDSFSLALERLPRLPVPWAIVILLAGSLFVALEGGFRKHKKEQEEAQSAIESLRGRATPDEWHNLAQRFRNHAGDRDQWAACSRRESEEFQGWVLHAEMRGGRDQFRPLYIEAGRLLARSANSLAMASQRARDAASPIDKWFFFMADKRRLQEQDSGAWNNDRVLSLVFENPADTSAEECEECAANET